MSRLLSVLHKTAQDLHEGGLMDAVTMRKFDALCLPSIRRHRATQIRRLRQRAKASPAYLNTSTARNRVT
jgi:putative transcriptional regulator